MDLPFFPAPASTVARQVDLLLLVLLALSGFFTTIVVALIAIFSIRYRRGNTAIDRSDAPTTSLKMELGWILGLFILGMGTFTGATAVYFRMVTPPEDAMEVYVIGRQWMWKVQHPDGPSEINTLHVPRGRAVRLIMTSQDVIHSFYVPAFRLKFDAIPGRYTNLWFEATRSGEYHIFCAEYCGTKHAGMIGTVIVMEPGQYQDWLAGSSGAPVVGAGEQLFQQLGCSACHASGSSVNAPDLTGLFGTQVPLEDGGTVTADENYLRESIVFPLEKIVAGYQPIMPAYEGRVTEEQLLQLVEYIKSLGTEAAQPEP